MAHGSLPKSEVPRLSSGMKSQVGHSILKQELHPLSERLVTPVLLVSLFTQEGIMPILGWHLITNPFVLDGRQP